ncbi:putative N-acetyltransferase YjaB [Blastopirellula retiformator]|uniref:Putative N-acetyltransferase YjaB n=1 Tax=Blastopirellula retiformator TaxID=2527970 RepID=A0A5C5VLM9_9BACT|nr:putative N-acetyltransferase YjaB [Blastopirellula retiformator]
MKIRPATNLDRDPLVEIWLKSVRQTHTFLTEEEIQYFLPIVRNQALVELEVWVLVEEPDLPLGFMCLDGKNVEALFLAPEYFRQGGGKRLIEYARHLKGPLSVDVNEQNPAAIRFYESQNFVPIGRSELDSSGFPFPLIHMRQPT